jgi:cytidyltransferase-like protein
MLEYIFTIGCFDKLHKGHIKLLESMKEKSKKIIIGLHDNDSINKLKNITDIDSYEDRKKNLEKYADDIFMIDDVDPTKSIEEYISKNFSNNLETTIYNSNKISFDYDNFELYGSNIKRYVSYKYITKYNSRCHEIPIGIRLKHMYVDNNCTIFNERDYGSDKIFNPKGIGRLHIQEGNSEYIPKTFDIHNNNTIYGGSEDYRYIIFNNELYVVLNGLPNDSNVRQMYLYNVNKDKISHLHIKYVDVKKIYQKNWTPYVYNNSLYFVYSFCKLCVVKLINIDNGECEIVHGNPLLFTNKDIFGGTNLCYWKDDLYIGFGHIRKPWYSVPIIYNAKTFQYISSKTPMIIDLPFKINSNINKVVQYPYNFTKEEDKYELSVCHQDICSIKYVISDSKINNIFNELLNNSKLYNLEAINIGSSTINSKVINSTYRGKLFFMHEFHDTFKYSRKDDNIQITRTDKNSGWGQNLIGYKKNWCFVRGDDNTNFPSINYIKSIMPIKYLPYTKEISATELRNYKDNKVGLMNYLLQKVVKILNDNNIPYHLDCGTLLGCVRENGLMKKDSDIDVTTHLSYWDKLNAIDFTQYDLIRTRTYKGYPEKNNGNMISVKTNFSNIYCDIYTNPAFPQLDNIVLNGNNYSIPINSDLYLTQLYGNWRVPSKQHASTTYHRGNGLVKSEYSKYWDKNYKIFECNM